MHSTARQKLRTTSLVLLGILTVPFSPIVLRSSVTAASGPSSAVPANADNKTIVHVLNRLGFGATPGDVERVRRMGLDKYIDQQLRPETIPTRR